MAVNTAKQTGTRQAKPRTRRTAAAETVKKNMADDAAGEKTAVQTGAEDGAVRQCGIKPAEADACGQTAQSFAEQTDSIASLAKEAAEPAAEREDFVLNEHSQKVSSMFKAITKRYDLLNHVCSLGIDFWWRKVLVAGFVLGKTNKILDMAAGTLDVSAAALKKFPDATVVAGDICPEMLEYGKKKIKEQDKERIEVKCINALSIPYGENSFDAVSMAFGIRNVDDRLRALSEMHRVLTVGGQLHILEFSPVANPVLQKCYYFYLEKVMPALAGLLGENADAYKYLARTIENFPNQQDFCAEIKKAGFEFVGYKTLTFGIVTVYTAVKSK